VLEKIVITAESSIAGEFNVDCQGVAITPTANVGNVVTYSLTSNFALSTSQESVFYIALPAVELGDCTVEFIESTGEKMVATWSPSKPLSKGVVREFNTIIYEPKSDVVLQSLEAVEDEFAIFYDKVYGHIKYSDGSPIANVAVSDGFQVVTTDSNGYYEMSGITPETWYIYCSLPADVKVPIDELGRPCFFKKYPANSPQYDFTFEKLPGGKEEEFVIFALADPQPGSTSSLKRFAAQAAPEIKSYSKTLNLPCYGVVLGDIVSMSDKNNIEHLMPLMRAEMTPDKIGMPMFPVMGNHDNAFVCDALPIVPDERNYTANIKMQRPFEECFGPVNYSFNRGDLHIVAMRNIQYISNTNSSDYNAGFTAEQYKWIQQDLALVPKDKMVVLCVHIPHFNRKGHYVQETLSMMDEYAEAHILSGHYHANEPYDHAALGTGHKVFEHSLTSVNGASWKCNLAADGTPNGYTLFYVKGNTFTKWYHKGYAYGMNDPMHQMRLYRGGTITGAEKEGSDSNGTKGYYQFPYDSNTILANVFSSDPWGWTVEVWNYDETAGVKTTKIGNMTSLFKYKDYIPFSQLIGDGSYENPRRVDSTKVTELAHDFWATGVLLGKLGAKTPLHYEKDCWTMWKFILPEANANATVMVVARDKFGNEYTETKFQDGTDMTYALYDPQYNPVIE